VGQLSDSKAERPSLRDEHKQLTLQKIVKAARTIFHDKGYGPATVDEIVDAANVSRGTFYVYFHSKSEVMNELFASEHVKDVIALVEELDDDVSVDNLRDWIERFFDIYRRDRLTIRAWIQAGSREAALRQSSLGLLDQVLDRLAERVQAIRCAHGLSSSADEVRVRALLMFIQMQEFAYFPMIRGYPVDESIGLDILAEQWYAALMTDRPERRRRTNVRQRAAR
jgi:AcrR family transcriptional regulator